MRRVAFVGLVLVGSLFSNGCGCSDDEGATAAGPGADAAAGTGGRANTGGTAGMDSGSDAATGGTSGADAGLEFWTAWERVRLALRTSPDHLPARAAELVLAKDPAKIFEFVRDSIATYPS